MKKTDAEDNHSENDYPNEKDKELFRAILKLKTVDEAMRFFRDLLTFAEIKEFAKRFEMAKLLESGLPYWEVAEKCRCSTTTVTRTAHWLHHGMGGYTLVLERMKKSK